MCFFLTQINNYIKNVIHYFILKDEMIDEIKPNDNSDETESLQSNNNYYTFEDYDN